MYQIFIYKGPWHFLVQHRKILKCMLDISCQTLQYLHPLWDILDCAIDTSWGNCLSLEVAEMVEHLLKWEISSTMSYGHEWGEHRKKAKSLF